MGLDAREVSKRSPPRDAVEMTFVIAKLTELDVGKLTLLSDTENTDWSDSTFTRQT